MHANAFQVALDQDCEIKVLAFVTAMESLTEQMRQACFADSTTKTEPAPAMQIQILRGQLGM